MKIVHFAPRLLLLMIPLVAMERVGPAKRRKTRLQEVFAQGAVPFAAEQIARPGTPKPVEIPRIVLSPEVSKADADKAVKILAQLAQHDVVENKTET